jgi:hypothetical protein
MEVSLRRFAADPGRGETGRVEFLADSEAVSGGEDRSLDGWLAANGLRDAHPATTVSTETNKIFESAHLKEPISRVGHAVGSNCGLDCWLNFCCGIAAFTGGP